VPFCACKPEHIREKIRACHVFISQLWGARFMYVDYYR
jgi:hypothetical protein